jgi:uncharacterized protein YkwD
MNHRYTPCVNRFVASAALAVCCSVVLAATDPLPGSPGAPAIRVPLLERHILDLINDRRTESKLRPLHADDRLTLIARAHSEDMVRRGFFDHINAQGEDPTARGKRAGYECRKALDKYSFREGLAENLSEVPRASRVRISGDQKTYDWNTAEDIGRQAVDGWMKSPGHRRNILDGNYSDSGIGVAVSSNDIYITQLFC